MSLVGGTKILIWQEKYSLLYSLSNAYVGKAQSIQSFMRNFYPKQFFHSNVNSRFYTQSRVLLILHCPSNKQNQSGY